MKMLFEILSMPSFFFFFLQNLYNDPNRPKSSFHYMTILLVFMKGNPSSHEIYLNNRKIYEKKQIIESIKGI